MVRRFKAYGFTLVELLTVVAVIAVLIAILMPALRKARDQATATQCLSNIRQVGQIVMQYAADYRGVVPMGFMSGNTSAAGGSVVNNWGDFYGVSYGTSMFMYTPQVPDAGTSSSNISVAPGVSGYTFKSGARGMLPTLNPLVCPNVALVTATSGTPYSTYQGVFATYYGMVNGSGAIVTHNSPGAIPLNWGPEFAVYNYGSDIDNGGVIPTPAYCFRGLRLGSMETPSDYLILADSVWTSGGQNLLNDANPQGCPNFPVNANGMAGVYGGGNANGIWLSHPNNTASGVFGDGHGEMCDIGRLYSATNYNPCNTYTSYASLNNPVSLVHNGTAKTANGITYYVGAHGITGFFLSNGMKSHP